jgi:hypothetical protein
LYAGKSTEELNTKLKDLPGNLVIANMVKKIEVFYGIRRFIAMFTAFH